MDRTVRSNMLKMWLDSVLRAAASACLSVTAAFFLFQGMTDLQIGFHASLSQAVGLIVSLSCSGMAAGFQDSRKAIGLLSGLRAVFILGYALFCVVHASSGVFYTMMLTVGTLLAIETAIRNIFEYKRPCETIDMTYYSVLLAYSSLMGGITGTVVGFVIPVMYQRFDFITVTGVCLVLSAVFSLLSALANLWLKPLQNPTELPHTKLTINPIQDLKQLLSHRDFRYLLLPNFIRGLGLGVISLAALIAVRGVDMTEGNTPMITSAANIGTMLSSFVYVFLTRKLGVPKTALFGSLLFGVVCFATVGGTTMFLILYCVGYIGYNIVSNALPDMVYRTTDPSIISSFHTWRLAVSNVGTVVAAALYGWILDKVPAFVLLVLAFLGTLGCAGGYYLCYRKRI